MKEAQVDLAPLTLLIGANSSGKSSLIQSVLLLSQACNSASHVDRFPLNGYLTSLGGYDEVCRESAEEEGITIGATIRPSSSIVGRGPVPRGRPQGSEVVLDWRMRLKGSDKHDPGSALVESVDVEVSGRGRARGDYLRLQANRARKQTELQEAFERAGLASASRLKRRARGPWGSRLRGGSLAAWFSGELDYRGHTQAIHGLQLVGGMPRGVLSVTDSNTLLAREWLEEVLGRVAPVPRTRERRGDPGETERKEDELINDFVTQSVLSLERLGEAEEGPQASLQLFLDDRGNLRVTPDERMNLRRRSSEVLDRIIERLGEGRPVLEPEWPYLLNDVVEEATLLFGQDVSYVGPLRENPRFIYSSLQTPGPAELGPRGENLAAILHSDRRVQCPQLEGPDKSMPLKDAIGYWMSHIGLAGGLWTTSRGRLGLEMRIQDPQVARKLDLSNVGVGVSQVLPVVAASLLASPGGLVLLEQPELHLHPGAQQRLADFLIAIAQSGRQLIVESHSEHLLNRVRLRVAQDPDDGILEDVGVVFADRRDGVTRYTQVEIDRFGGLEPEAPKDFFEHAPSMAEEIMSAAISKKRAGKR